MSAGIYEILNTTDGERYIGSAVDIARRWKQHRIHLRRGSHHSPYLQRAWSKHGAEAFRFTVVETCSAAALLPREQHYLDALLPGYNSAKIAGSRLGVRHSAESIAKIARASLGHTLSPESRAKVSAAKRGQKRPAFSREWLDNLSKAAPTTKSAAHMGAMRLGRHHLNQRGLAWVYGAQL